MSLSKYKIFYFLKADAFWDKVYVCVDKNTYNNKYLEEYA